MTVEQATVESVLPLLKDVRADSRGYRARCPAHRDRTRALRVWAVRSGFVVICLAGCARRRILRALERRRRNGTACA